MTQGNLSPPTQEVAEPRGGPDPPGAKGRGCAGLRLRPPRGPPRGGAAGRTIFHHGGGRARPSLWSHAQRRAGGRRFPPAPWGSSLMSLLLASPGSGADWLWQGRPGAARPPAWERRAQGAESVEDGGVLAARRRVRICVRQAVGAERRVLIRGVAAALTMLSRAARR